MALLKSLKLSPYNPTNRNNSFLKRRRKLIAKIDEQILIATDSNYQSTKIKWVLNEDHAERKLKIQNWIRRWWFETDMLIEKRKKVIVRNEISTNLRIFY